MSFDSDADYYDGIVSTNASCHDCGIDYAKADHDPGVWCDGCSNRRDAWTTAQEVRSMAKAVLSADLSKIRDVA